MINSCLTLGLHCSDWVHNGSRWRNSWRISSEIKRTYSFKRRCFNGNRIEAMSVLRRKTCIFEDVRYKVDPFIEWIVYGIKCRNKDCIMHQDQKFYMNEDSALAAWNKRVT